VSGVVNAGDLGGFRDPACLKESSKECSLFTVTDLPEDRKDIHSLYSVTRFNIVRLKITSIIQITCAWMSLSCLYPSVSQSLVSIASQKERSNAALLMFSGRATP